MPPKAPAARGRGRGRGRGTATRGTTTTRPSAASDLSMQDAPPQSETETTPAASNAHTTEAPGATTQSAQSDMSPPALPESNTLPVAPKRTPSTRRPASATPAPSTRGAKKTAIPAPRAIRRSKEERETIEKAEQKKRSDEARTALREQRRAGRGRGDFHPDRGRGGKARGGFMGDRERNIREQVASGPFSAGQVSAADASIRRRPGGSGGFAGPTNYLSGGRAGPSGSGAYIKSEGGTYRSSYSVVPEDGGYISSDDDAGDEGPRQDIDIIDISDDDNQGPTRTMVPIRVSRVEHKEREKPVSTEVRPSDTAANPVIDVDKIPTNRRTSSPTATRKNKPRGKDVQTINPHRKWKGAWSDSEDSEADGQIKSEPSDHAALPHVPIKESSSPESKRKSAKARPENHALPTEAPPGLTMEERREWERHHLDLELLREELGHLSIPPPELEPVVNTEGATVPTGANGDVAMGDAAAEEQPAVDDRRKDRVYLFQFPPILPTLTISSGPGGVKKEAPPSPELSRRAKPNLAGPSTSINTEDAPINLDDIPDILDTPAATGATANSKENPLKVEDGGAHVPTSAGQSTYRDVPSGFVGKLRVHASGRTFLDWGGTSMQIGMGTDVQFLQDVMVTRFFEPEEKLEDMAGKSGPKDMKKEVEEPKGPGGEALGLGQIRGKFVVTPDWEEIVGQRI